MRGGPPERQPPELASIARRAPAAARPDAVVPPMAARIPVPALPRLPRPERPMVAPLPPVPERPPQAPAPRLAEARPLAAVRAQQRRS